MYSISFIIIIAALVIYAWVSMSDQFEEIGDKIQKFIEFLMN